MERYRTIKLKIQFPFSRLGSKYLHLDAIEVIDDAMVDDDEDNLW